MRSGRSLGKTAWHPNGPYGGSGVTVTAMTTVKRAGRYSSKVTRYSGSGKQAFALSRIELSRDCCRGPGSIANTISIHFVSTFAWPSATQNHTSQICVQRCLLTRRRRKGGASPAQYAARCRCRHQLRGRLSGCPYRPAIEPGRAFQRLR
jgi:hypothetical protein